MLFRIEAILFFDKMQITKELFICDNVQFI